MLSMAMLLGVGCQSAEPTPDEAPSAEQAAEKAETQRNPRFPATKRQDISEEIFGQTVRDPYRWLEDNDAEEVQAWMEEQNDYARDYLDGLDHRERLRTRYEELYYIESTSAPTRRGGRMFYARQHPDKEKEVYYWRPVDGGADDEQVLLDPNEMGDGENISVGDISPTWDGQTVAYTLKENNADQATLYIKDVESGEVSDIDVIEEARWAEPSWSPDNSGFYYTRYPNDESIPKAKRPGKADVRYHELGTDPANDRLVRPPTDDPRTFQGVEVSRDGRWLLHAVWHGWNRSDIYYKDLEAEEPTWKTLVEGKKARYSVDIWKDTFYIKTDEGAGRFRVFKAKPGSFDRESWTEIVPEQEESVLEGLQVVGGHLVLSYLQDAHSRIDIRTLAGEKVRTVDLPGVGSTYGVSGQPDDDRGFFTYQSFTSPKQVYSTSIKEGGTELWSQEDVPVDTSKYTSEQVWYTSKDGTKVSMFVVHKKGVELDGSMPFLLYGYGGFDVSLKPHFRESVIPLLKAGGGYAVANLRGGGEYGKAWHEAGMLDKKQNTFDDFIAAAEYLVEEGYTASDRLAIEGGSNGGLLVSAVTTQRPELFEAVLCSVPLTDMVRYNEFGPAKIWMHEYGDPAKEDHFEFLYDYSPYHNVDKGADYPAFMMLSSAKDDRVHPMHARKMTAQLQWATGSDEPVLFRLEKKAGHGGANLIKSRVRKSVDKMSFILHELSAETGDGEEEGASD